MPADVAVLIVTYNSEEQIEACLRSVQTQRKTIRQQIIVVDNDSKDGTVALIREKFPEVKLVLPGANLGFAKGVNLAASHADAEFVLLLNPDTVVVDHAIDVVVSFARSHPHYGLYGGRTLKPDGSLEPSSCWGLPSLWSLGLFAFGITTLAPRNRWLDPESLGGWARDTVREVGVITGCFLLTSKTAWDQLGGLDERYFMYGEDTAFSLKAWQTGFRPVICPDARVIHEVGQSSSTPLHKALLLYRGKASYVRARWSGVPRALGLALLKVGVGLRAAAGVLLRGKNQTWREQGRRHDCGAFTLWVLHRSPQEGRPVPSGARVGVVASRVAVGNAIQRNRAKRRMRELFRKHQAAIPGTVDLLIVARSALNRLEYVELDRRFVDACRKLFPSTPVDV